jgi:Glycosyltransferase
MNLKSFRLCFIGNMLGRNAGYITTQGMIIADLFAKDGYEVVSSSPKLNRALRLMDIARTIVENKNSIDVLVLDVYSGKSMIIADTASLLCKRLKIPLISVLRGGNLPVFMKRYPRWTRRVFKRADILVAPSFFLAEEMEREGFRVRVVPNVINLAAYPFRQRRQIAPNLIWMRSFHEIYNPQMALQVLEKLRWKYREATLVMAGTDKGLEPEIKALAEKMGLRSAVRFPGFLSREEKAREFSQADVYINTNRIDNMPVSVVEACAFGLPVVATDVGGISHLLTHGENGLLVADGGVDEMAVAVERLLDDEELTAKLSKNGRRLAERSDWAFLKNVWLEMFEKLTGEEKRDRRGKSDVRYAQKTSSAPTAGSDW